MLVLISLSSKESSDITVSVISMIERFISLKDNIIAVFSICDIHFDFIFFFFFDIAIIPRLWFPREKVLKVTNRFRKLPKGRGLRGLHIYKIQDNDFWPYYFFLGLDIWVVFRVG